MEKRRYFAWNVPNALTLVRLFLVPVLWVLMLGVQEDMWGLAVFAAASITDMLDGIIARKTNSITDFGKLVDPLADKLMVLSVLCTLTIRGIVPLLPVLLLGVKELLMVAGSLFMLKKRIVVHSLFIGKAAQVVLCIAMIVSFFWASFVKMSIQPHLVILWVGIALAYAAFCVYTIKALHQLSGKEKTYKEQN